MSRPSESHTALSSGFVSELIYKLCFYISIDPGRPKETTLESPEGDLIEIGLETACVGHPSLTQRYQVDLCLYEAARDCTSVDMDHACQGKNA